MKSLIMSLVLITGLGCAAAPQAPTKATNKGVLCMLPGSDQPLQFAPGEAQVSNTNGGLTITTQAATINSTNGLCITKTGEE